MSQATCCKIEDCDRKVIARGICKLHYQRFTVAGTLDAEAPLVPNVSHHRLTDIDEDEQTATCSRCGPVGVRYRKSRGWYECRGHRKAKQRARRYGMSATELAEFLEASAGRCAICNRHVGSGGQVDHCHSTGAVRGLLCRPCNLGLGYFRDDPEILAVARRYLARNLRQK